MNNLQSDFESTDASPGFLLWRVTNNWQAAQRRALEPFGLTHVQFVILASLVWLQSSDGLNQKQLANHAGIDVMMTSQVLRALEGKGLIDRHQSPSDKRAIIVSASDKGRLLANQTVKVVERVDNQYFSVLGRHSADFTHLLGRLNRADDDGYSEKPNRS